MGTAAWLFARTRRETRAARHHQGHHHHDDHGHQHHDAAVQFVDEHEQEHGREIQKRFANRQATTGQVILFGLTGGLLPCPSAFAVLLVCLHLKLFALGFAVVLAFSLGLAITLVSVGSVAAFTAGQATKRFNGFGEWARKMPYVSSTVMALIGAFVTMHGLKNLLR